LAEGGNHGRLIDVTGSATGELNAKKNARQQIKKVLACSCKATSACDALQVAPSFFRRGAEKGVAGHSLVGHERKQAGV